MAFRYETYIVFAQRWFKSKDRYSTHDMAKTRLREAFTKVGIQLDDENENKETMTGWRIVQDD